MATPPVSWTLQKNNGSAQTLAGWKISQPRMHFGSLEDDYFAFTVTGNVKLPAPFTWNDTVVLFRNGVRWFTGTINDVTASGTPKESRWRIKAMGPWFQLSRTMYQQPILAVDPSGCSGAPFLTTKVVLYQNEQTTAAITTGSQITNALNYALSLNIPVTAGAIMAGVSAPFEIAQDLTIADVIRRGMQLSPDAVGWFDYLTVRPTFNCSPRSGLESRGLSVGIPGSIVQDFDVTSRDDLLPTGVRFNYLGVKSCPKAPAAAGCSQPVGGGGDYLATTVQKDEVGLPDQPGGLISTITLAQTDPGVNEPVPTGLAALYWASLKPVNFSGSVTIREVAPSGQVRVRNTLNLTNANGAWAAMNATVQQIDEELMTGTTKITIGPPGHLSSQDFVTLIQFARRRPLVTNSFPATRAPGTTMTPNCNAGLDADSKKANDWSASNPFGLINGLLNNPAALDAVTTGVTDSIATNPLDPTDTKNKDKLTCSVASNLDVGCTGGGDDGTAAGPAANSIIKAINSDPAKRAALADATKNTPAFQTKTLAACEKGVSVNVKVYGPP